MTEDATNKPGKRKERIGKYEILEHLASGGMGAVYKARDVDLDRVVALKILPPDMAANPAMLERFRREARAAACLRHENIVAIYDVGESGGTHFLALEFVDGTDLQDYINRKCRLHSDEARVILIQAVQALAHAHEQGVVHRDIKPSNFLLTVIDGRLIVKLTDLGLAMQVHKDEDFRVTRHGTTVGTVDYMAPEQARNSAAADVRSDLYSLGCTLYHMLAGEAPFPRGSLTERIIQHLEAPPPDVRKLNKAIPTAFLRILYKMLAKDPLDRYQTPADLLVDLDKLDRVAKREERARALEAASGKPRVSDPTQVVELPGHAVELAGEPVVEPAGDELNFESMEKPAKPVREKTRKGPKEPRTAKGEKDKTPVPASPDDDDVVLVAPLPKGKDPRKLRDDPDDAKAPPLEAPKAKKPREPRNAESGEEKAPRKPREQEPSGDKPAPPAKAPKRLRDDDIDAEDEATPVQTKGPRKLRDEDIDDPQPVQAKGPRWVRDEDNDEETPAHKKGGVNATLPPWMFIAGAAAVLAVVSLVLWMTSGGPARKKDDPPPTPPPVVVNPDDKKEPPFVRVDTSPDKMGIDLGLPMLVKTSLVADRAALRREFLGPFKAFPGVPDKAPVLRVSRGAAPAPDTFRSLAEALAATKPNAASIVEIADPGPHYCPAFAPLDQREIYLRGSGGQRALLVWDLPKANEKDKAPAAWWSQSRGKLVLDGIDIAVQWADAQADTPAALFHLDGAEFHARDCTFAQAGKHPHGVAVVRLAAPKDAKPKDTTAPTPIRFTRCYSHGIDLTALSIFNTSADVLVEQSLLVCQQAPLLRVAAREIDTVSLRLVRSTLVAGQFGVLFQPPSDKHDAPRVQFSALDSILARNDTSASNGDLLHFPEPLDARRVEWKVTNSAYAGWKKLLASKKNAIAGHDAQSWRSLWLLSESDQALPDTWPNTPGTQLDEVAPGAFTPYDTSLAFLARSATGALGAPLGLLPETPPTWVARVFERRPFASLPDLDDAPPFIENAMDGLYHGERIDLTKIDLGQHLQMRLQAQKPAPRVVLHLTGRGARPTSPIRVKGTHLVLYFEPTKDPKDALTLEVSPRSVGNQAALVEVDKGHLELVNVRIRFENNAIAVMPAHMVKVQEADLTLVRCTLQGPLTRVPDTFKGLVAFQGAGASRAEPFQLTLRDSVLLSGRQLVTLADPGMQVRAKNCVFASLGGGVVHDDDGPPVRNPQASLAFENCTWAVRQAVFALKLGNNAPTWFEPIHLQMQGCLFVDPYAESPPQATLLKAPEAALARNLIRWQGKRNAIDARWHAHFAPWTNTPPPPSTLADWLRLWGRAGEQDAVPLDPAHTAKMLLTPESPQLDRLALPRDPRFTSFGADLVRLGLLKK